MDPVENKNEPAQPRGFFSWVVAGFLIVFELIRWAMFDNQSTSSNPYKSFLVRVQEPEAMDTAEEASEYDAMDHSVVNQRFVDDFLTAHGACQGREILDVGTGTAQIPITLCQTDQTAIVRAVDLAQHMLDRAAENVKAAGFSGRIALQLVDAKGLPFADSSFEAVISNSIIHHIPDPLPALGEMARLVAPGGTLMVRDLVRPDSSGEVQRLVDTYAADESEKARALFDASLRAAFRLDEVRAFVSQLKLNPNDVTMTSDRHWTWVWRRQEEATG